MFDFDGPNSLAYKQPFKVLQAAAIAPRRIRGIIRQFKPDVVISFLKGMNLLTWRAIRSYGPDRPIWIAREGNNALRVIAEEAPNFLARKLVEWLTKRAYSACDILLGVSSRQIQDLKFQFKLRNSEARYIHNGVDIAAIQQMSQSRPKGLPGRDFMITAGRLEPQKGHDILLRAYAGSEASRSVDLVVLGVGTLADDLKALCEQLGIASKVHFMGFQDNPWCWFSHAKLFVLPSLWEGFSNALVEALACGLPVLSSDCKYGPSEIVRNGENGYCVSPGDVQALRLGMDKIMTNARLQARLAEQARKDASTFDVSQMCSDYEQLIAQACTRQFGERCN